MLGAGYDYPDLPGLGNNNEKLGLPERLSTGVIESFFPRSVPPGKMARGENYYRSVTEPFFPHSQFSPTEKSLYSRISPPEKWLYSGIPHPPSRKNGYIVGFPPERMTT